MNPEAVLTVVYYNSYLKYGFYKEHYDAYKQFIHERFCTTETSYTSLAELRVHAETWINAWNALTEEERGTFIDSVEKQKFVENHTKMVDIMYKRNGTDKGIRYKLPLQVVTTNCKWIDCQMQFENEAALEQHLTHTHCRESETSEQLIKCMWLKCSVEFEESQDLLDHILDRHMKFHKACRLVLPEHVGSNFVKMQTHVDDDEQDQQSSRTSFDHDVPVEVTYKQKWAVGVQNCLFHPTSELLKQGDKVNCVDCSRTIRKLNDKNDVEWFNKVVDCNSIDLEVFLPIRLQYFYESSILIRNLCEFLEMERNIRLPDLQIHAVKLVYDFVDSFIFKDRTDLIAFTIGVISTAKASVTNDLITDLSTIENVDGKTVEAWRGKIDTRQYELMLMRMIKKHALVEYCIKLGLSEKIRAKAESVANRLFDLIDTGHYERVSGETVQATALWYTIQASTDNDFTLEDILQVNQSVSKWQIFELYNDSMSEVIKMFPDFVKFMSAPRLEIDVADDGKITYTGLEKEYLENGNQMNDRVRKKFVRGIIREPSFDKQCLTHVYPFEVKLRHKIERFIELTKITETGTPKYSKAFRTMSMPFAYWQIVIYPGGRKDANNISLFLKLNPMHTFLASGDELHVEAKYRFNFIGNNNRPEFSKDSIGHFHLKSPKWAHKCGINKIPLDEVARCIRKDGSLLVTCHVELANKAN